MSTRRTSILSLSILIWLFSGQVALSQDIDVPRARAAYEDARRRADQAREDLRDEERRFQPYADRYRDAQRQVNELENQLDRARTNLENARNELQRLQDVIDRGQSDLDNLRARKDQIQGRIDQLQQRKDNIQSRIRDIESRLADINQKLQAAEQAGDQAEIDRLRTRKAEVEGNLAEARQNLQEVNNDIQRARNEVQDVQRDIDNKRQQIADAQARKPQLQNDRDRYQGEVSRLQPQLQNARDNERQRQSELNVAQAALDSVRSTVRVAENDEQRALSYYQQVQENYNRARDRSIAKGREAGLRDGSREADSRSDSAGNTAGNSAAQTTGRQVGETEARVISNVRGYKSGRAEPNQNAATTGAYRQGQSEGEGMANAKAKLEDFPKGFNQALDGFLQSTPSHQDVIDISDAISNEPGDQSSLLRLVKKPIQTGTTPSFGMPSEPAYRIPGAPSPSFSIPNANRSQFNSPCRGLELPEFDRLCDDAYGSHYDSGFRSSYDSGFRQAYQSEFNNRIRGYYDSARNQNVQSEMDGGLRQGATHQGILDGFASHLAVARQEQHQAGINELTRLTRTGYFLYLRSVAVVGERADGIISPGEQLKLKIQIDNIGVQSTPREKVRIQITQTSGVTATVKTRLLPALAGDTSTTLEGVIPATVATEIVNGKLSLNVDLQVEKAAGQFESIASASTSEEVHFPIELVDVAYTGALAVGQKTQANLTFKNLTNQDFGDTPLVLTAAPQNLAFEAAEHTVPALSAGESITIPVNITPDVTAGSNLMTRIRADLRGVYGVASMIQAKDQRLSLKRNASLNLCLQSGCDANIALPLQVRGGTEVAFPISFKFQATARVNGPFIIEKESVSSTKITAGNNSVARVNLGSWSPGSSAYRGNFIYRVPADLQGQDHWVRVRLLEANKNIHSIMIPFKVVQ